MHLSKLQGKRSLGLSALLAQRNVEIRPVGVLHSPGDELSSDSKFSHSEDQKFSSEQTSATVAAVAFEMNQEFFNLQGNNMMKTAGEQPLLQSELSPSTGSAKWLLNCGQSSGVATWNMNDLMAVALPSCRQEHAAEAMYNSLENGQIFALSQADVNIFHQNSRDINSIFIEKQKRMIVDLNTATASLKLQLLNMQQERDDFVLEVSTLNVALEEQKHEQQTQLLSFSLKLLQDEAEMRKYQDAVHEMRGEMDL